MNKVRDTLHYSFKNKNKPQVTIVSSGPGVTNVITPIADAFYDSVPMVVFTGQETKRYEGK